MNGLIYKFAKRCELPGKSVFWNFLNFFFCQLMILFGLSVYKKIKKEFPDKRLLFIPSKSVGDVMFYCYFKDYMYDYIDSNESETILIWADGIVNACKTFQIPNVYPISMPKLAALQMAYHYYGIEKMNMVNAYPWCLFDLVNIQNKNIRPHPPALPDCREKLLSQLSDIDCVPGRTVVLSPYEQTLTSYRENIPEPSFWSELAEALKNEGFSVCTNCRGDEKEPAIPGTKRIFPKLNECSELVTLAGASVMIRSGFADFTVLSPAPLVILYPSSQYWNYFKVWGTDEFSDHHEIIYKGTIDEPEYRRELINEIIKMVKHEKID